MHRKGQGNSGGAQDVVVIERRSRVHIVRLNRPDRLNAFNEQMHAMLIDALEQAGSDPECRVVVLTGSGRGFCGGQDLVQPLDGGDQADLGAVLERWYNRLIRLIRRLDIPVIAAVNGPAAGAGANIALACDIVIAGRSARFVQAFSKIGLVPDAGGTWFLPRLVGGMRARAMTMLGEPIDADRAEALGLVWKVVDDNRLMDEAEALAVTLSELPHRGLALTKQALEQSFENTLDEQLDLERDYQSKAGRTDDFREAVRAFRERRKPSFAGSRG